MRIGWVEPHLEIVGAIRRVGEMSNHLAKRGHNIFIYTPTGASCSWFNINAKVKHMDMLSKDPLDIVIFNMPEYYKKALSSKAKLKVHYVLSYEPMYRKSPAIESYKASYFRIANSQFIADKIWGHTGIMPPIVGGGINTDHFRPVDVSKIYDILCYGSFRPWKGTHIIKEACVRADVRFNQFEGKGLSQISMGAEYSKAHMVVSACSVEGFNYVPLEAMACGVPVVMTDDFGSQDYVKHMYNAYVVSERLPKAVAQGIQRVGSDKKLQAKLIKGGLETTSREIFSWEYLTERFEQILLEEYNKK